MMRIRMTLRKRISREPSEKEVEKELKAPEANILTTTDVIEAFQRGDEVRDYLINRDTNLMCNHSGSALLGLHVLRMTMILPDNMLRHSQHMKLTRASKHLGKASKRDIRQQRRRNDLLMKARPTQGPRRGGCAKKPPLPKRMNLMRSRQLQLLRCEVFEKGKNLPRFYCRRSMEHAELIYTANAQHHLQPRVHVILYYACL